MKNKTQAYYRYQRHRTIQRKVHLLKHLRDSEFIEVYIEGDMKDTYFGKLSKGKIHCSCPLCRTKSYDEWSHRDKLHQQRMDAQEKEYLQTKD